MGYFNLDYNRIFGYNLFEGIKLGLGGETSSRLSTHFTVGGYISYGLKDKSIHHGGIHHVTKQHAVILALVRRLQHQNAKQVQRGVDKKRGARDAAPVLQTFRAGRRRDARGGAHGKAKAKAISGRQHFTHDRNGAQVVCRHEVHGA